MIRTLIGAFLLSAMVAMTHAAETTDKPVAEELRVAKHTLQMARSGQYGSVSTRQLIMAESAVDQISSLLEDQSSVEDLSVRERERVQTLLARLERVLRARNKNRMVCSSVRKTGSRISTLECLTIAQREARARNARERTQMQQQGFCVQGVEGGSRCTLGG